MAVKASATITISRIIDIVSTTNYYLLQSSTATPPSKPTTDPPGGSWSTTEPTYTEGSTNTLYTVIKTKYSGNIPGQNVDFEYTPVSKSTSYEAAKDAYIKATNAQTAALAADKIIMSATEPTSASDKTKIWYDMNTQKFKKWFEANPDDPDSVAEWRVISDFSNDINVVKDIATAAQTAAGQIDSKIENANAAQTTQILNEVETRTQAALSVQQTNILASVSQSIANNNTIQNVVTNFSFETTGLYIGKTDSLYKLLLANDKISMLYYENDTPIELSYWNRNLFYSTKVKTEEIEIAPFRWVKRANGSLSLRKDG